MSVFICLAPALTALGLHFFVKSERLSAMFGVACGVAFLGEPLSGRFGLAALAVGAGIALVNLRR